MCAHGKLPVPAPATALIFEGVPYYSDGLKGELCTPTGAALIKYFADDFSNMPAMVVEKTGYGFGKKEFERLNCVRALWELLFNVQRLLLNVTIPAKRLTK